MRCPYHPINGKQCRRRGTAEIALRPAERSPMDTPTWVCEEHLPHYLAHGWVLLSVAAVRGNDPIRVDGPVGR